MLRHVRVSAYCKFNVIKSVVILVTFGRSFVLRHWRLFRAIADKRTNAFHIYVVKKHKHGNSQILRDTPWACL